MRLADVKIELPVMPRTFYCVGLNYLKHLKEAADKRGEVPEHSRPARDRLSRAERADRA